MKFYSFVLAAAPIVSVGLYREDMRGTCDTLIELSSVSFVDL